MPRSALVLSTLGAFDVQWQGRPLAGIGNGKLAALLAYLATEPGFQRREMLAELLWPNASSDAARLNLRQTLFQLRNLLQESTGRSFVTTERQQVALDVDAPVVVDLAAFVKAQRDCPHGNADTCGACLAQKGEAIELYKGPFLANIDLPDSPAFMDWLHFKRESFHRQATGLLTELMDGNAAQGRLRAALAFALRYTELEPWSETGYLNAMWLYAQDGRRDAALALFETCRRVLERDLGVLPGKDIQTFVEDLRREAGPGMVWESPDTAPRPKERRQVTVLSCELHVAGLSDPEDALERLATPLALCEEIVRVLGGHTVQAHGGGLLAYFGYPQAQERSALHGLKAARRMVALTAEGLDVRVGIHQGFILTTGDLNLPDPVGMTSDVAIQLCAQAEAGEVLASGEVCRSATAYFTFTPLGPRQFRRMEKPVEVLRVDDESGVTHRLEAAARLTPLMGREGELRVLERAWGRARKGRFGALLISGDAGMGKSRLVREWADRVATGESIVYELRCFAETRHSPWQPVIEAYQAMAGIDAADKPEEKFEKLHSLFRRRVPSEADRALGLVAQMMGVLPEGSEPAAETLDTKLPELLVDLLRAIASQSPVLFILEDAHWADESTLAFISRLCAHDKDAAICLLVTARPEFEPNFDGLEILELPPLGDEAMSDLIGEIRGGMPKAWVASLVARADGIPLYAEELAALAPETALPGNLLDLLMARLDTLGEARAVAQLASCVGREIDEDFLGMVSDMPAATREAAVTRLLSSGLVRRLEDRRLQFKHALVQEAAYQSQPKAVRASAHRRIAEELEKGFGSLKTRQPEVLARHWSAAGEAMTAAGHWLAAGRHAAWNYAFHEAAGHYAEGLALLPKLAPGNERDKLEFSLLISLARVEQLLAGYGSDRAMAPMERALALLEQGVGDGVDRFHALWGLWEASGSKSGHEESLRIARQLQTLAEMEDDRKLRQQGHYAAGNSLFWMGELTQARMELERLIALEDGKSGYRVHDFYGRNVLLAARGYLSWVLWLQGETADAFALCSEVIRLATQLGTKFDLAFAYVFAVVLQRWEGNAEAVARLAEEGNRHASACQSLPFIVTQKMHQIWVAVLGGDSTAIAPIEATINAGLKSLSGGAIVILMPFAEMLLASGEVDKALTILDKALEHSELKQDRHCLPELHRLKGECLLLRGDGKAARASFESAMAVGRSQGALAFLRRAQAGWAKCMEQA